MTTWIDHVQRFIDSFSSSSEDRSALVAAQATCQNPQIQKFLGVWPENIVESNKQAGSLIQSLRASGNTVDALMVRFLINLPTFIVLLSPLEIPRAERESLITRAHVFTDQLSKHRELLPSVGFLCDIRGTGLNILGRYSASRRAFEMARDSYRQLADTQPALYLPALAKTLTNLGNLLSYVGRFREAHTSYDEAWQIFRRLEVDHPITYLPCIAMTLNSLGAMLIDKRDFPAARKVFRDMPEILRALPADQTNPNVPRGAGVFNNIGNLWCAVGDFVEARRAYEEALEIARRPSSDQGTANLHDEATTLNNLGNLMSEMCELPTARENHEKALDIYRQLAWFNPAVYLPYVGSTLNNLGSLLHQMRDFPAARLVFDEALDTYERFAAANWPAADSLGAASVLNNLGVLLKDMRDFPAASATFEKAIKLAEATCYHGAIQHLAKINVVGAYQYLLTDAAAKCAVEKAFAYSVAMRDGQARSGTTDRRELRATQNWLMRQSEKSGIFHRLLVPSKGSGGQLILGLIDQENCRFIALQEEEWKGLIPEKNVSNHLTRLYLARELWKSLPDAFQEALEPRPDRKQFIAISGDPLWSDFPWELLRFGEGAEDYFGLHYALPRLGGIQAKNLQSQLSLTKLGQRGGRMTVLAPYDTDSPPLTGVLDEIEVVKQAVEARGGHIAAFAKSFEASDLEIERQISLKPDIFYFSGHGIIDHEEEVLVLHRDSLSKNTPAWTPLFNFGKEHLALLADNRNAQLFSQHPLVVLNSCHTGRTRYAGGAREDLVSAFLAHGAGAVLATAVPIEVEVGKALGEALFDPTISRGSDIASVVVGTRRRLAREVCADVKSLYWGAWAMIHLHGSAGAALPFNTPPVKKTVCVN